MRDLTLRGVSSRGRSIIASGLFILMICGVSLSVSSCKRPEPEVFPLAALTTIRSGVDVQGEPQSTKKAYFVVANAPSEVSQVRAVVGEYIHAALAGEESDRHATVLRYFYRETAFTPRNYVEANRGYFEHDRIEFHARDLLVVVRSRRGSDELEFVFFPPDQLP